MSCTNFTQGLAPDLPPRPGRPPATFFPIMFAAPDADGRPAIWLEAWNYRAGGAETVVVGADADAWPLVPPDEWAFAYYWFLRAVRRLPPAAALWLTLIGRGPRRAPRAMFSACLS